MTDYEKKQFNENMNELKNIKEVGIFPKNLSPELDVEKEKLLDPSAESDDQLVKDIEDQKKFLSKIKLEDFQKFISSESIQEKITNFFDDDQEEFIKMLSDKQKEVLISNVKNVELFKIMLNYDFLRKKMLKLESLGLITFLNSYDLQKQVDGCRVLESFFGDLHKDKIGLIIFKDYSVLRSITSSDYDSISLESVDYLKDNFNELPRD